MDIWEGTSGYCYRAGLFGRSLFAIRFPSDVDMQCFDVVGPVATSNFGVCLDALCIFGLGIGVVAGDAQFFTGCIQVGNDQVDQILIGGWFMIAGRVFGFVAGLMFDVS
jgi:hypothetical protein